MGVGRWRVMEGNTLEQLVFEDYFNDPSADNLALIISCSYNLRVCERQAEIMKYHYLNVQVTKHETKQLGHLPVLKYAAASIATPADAALMMKLGCDCVFVGSGVFNSLDPIRRARAILQTVNKLGLGLFDMEHNVYPIYQTW